MIRLCIRGELSARGLVETIAGDDPSCVAGRAEDTVIHCRSDEVVVDVAITDRVAVTQYRCIPNGIECSRRWRACERITNVAVIENVLSVPD